MVRTDRPVALLNGAFAASVQDSGRASAMGVLAVLLAFFALLLFRAGLKNLAVI